MFRIILALVVTVLHVYVFWRLSTVPVVFQHVPRRALIAAAVFLWAAFFLDRAIAPETGSGLGVALELWSMTWMAVLFLTATCLLLVDGVTLFGLVLRGAARGLRGWAVVAGLALSCLALVQGLRAPVVREYEVRMDGLPAELDGTVVMALSDLHLGTVLGESWLQARISQIKEQKPDLIVLMGDVFEGHALPGQALVEGLHGLYAPYGVWGVAGNHDLYAAQQAVPDVFRAAHIRLLQNAHAELCPGLVLAGVDNLSSPRDTARIPESFHNALDNRPPGATILLSHAPVDPELAASLGTGLMLSGHTHGGQIWPFGYLVKRQFPYFVGRYEVGGMTLLVSRGAGTWGPRMRLWLPGEMLLITLRTATG
ncbi:MAG: metallophosphoesterase [Desulfovibrio sp.]